MDAEKLEFPAGTFNSVLCRWGIMFFPDLAGVLKSIHRILAKNGKFVATVWSIPPKVPWARVTMGVMQRILQLPPPQEGTPGVFSLAALGKLEQAFEQAGFADVRSKRINLTFEWDSADECTSWVKDTIPPVTSLMDQQPPAKQKEIWQAIKEAAKEFTTEDNRIRIGGNETIVVVGQC